MTKKTPTPGSDAWKTFVADAMAKDPSRRTDAEREAIQQAMAEDRPRQTPCGLEIPTVLAALEALIRQVDNTGLLIADDKADQAVMMARLAVAYEKNEPVEVPKSYN